MATLFISNIFKYHGLPKSIVFEWLFKKLGTKLNFSLAYHPQIDGQREIANLNIIDLLKAYVMEVNQCDQWKGIYPW